MVLVIGATGQLGRAICAELAEARLPIRAFVRSAHHQEHAAWLRAIGAQVIVGERRDLRALDEACADVDVVIAAASAALSRSADESIRTFDRGALLDLVAAADRAGVRQFIHVEIPGNFVVPAPVSEAQREVERRLRASGMAHTILQPSYVMESWLSPAVGFDPMQRSARIFGSGRQRISWISRADVARFAVECIDAPAARDAIVRVGGPEAMSPMEVVHTFEQLQGARYEVQHVLDDAILQLRARATDPVDQSFATLLLGYARGDEIPMEQTSATFGPPRLSVRDYARHVVERVHRERRVAGEPPPPGAPAPRG